MTEAFADRWPPRSAARPAGLPGRWAVAAALALLAGVALAATPAAAQDGANGAAAPHTTLDGIFTAAQAEQGQATFAERCTACHAQGYFTTTTFRRSWSGRAVYYLFSTIRATMPEDNPGSLRPREIVDLLAYILQLNGYPEGAEPLPEDSDALRGIIWEEHPSDPGR